jgi:hypothetical protein
MLCNKHWQRGLREFDIRSQLRARTRYVISCFAGKLIDFRAPRLERAFTCGAFRLRYPRVLSKSYTSSNQHIDRNHCYYNSLLSHQIDCNIGIPLCVHQICRWIKMHEIVTLQFGQQSNYLGTHFWNTQVNKFQPNSYHIFLTQFQGIILYIPAGARIARQP